MNDWRETVLCALLDCGTADLSLLDDVDVDIYQVIEECKEEFGSTNINYVMWVIFQKGFAEIQNVIEAHIQDLEEYVEDGSADDEDREELEQLRELDPYEDFDSYHNYLDTNVWAQKHGEIYRQYLGDALEAFEKITGFYITID